MMKRKRQVALPVRRILLCSLVAVADGAAFSSTMTGTFRSRRIERHHALHSTTLPDPPPSSRKIEEESNFWRSIISRDNTTSQEECIPCEPSLDAQGPLPFGAYQILGNPNYEPKPTCRLTVAIDSATEKASRQLHRFIDCGLTTFQLKHEQNNDLVYRKLHADTPATVLRACQFIIPFKTPSTSIMAQPSIVREEVLEALRRTGGDCIDTLQLEYTEGSQYHLDVLDILSELQREGLLRSIATKNFPPQLLRQAASCGFTIDTNQIECSLLDPTHYTKELQLACQDLGVQLVISNPLAGGMLTSKFSNTRHEPPPWELSPTERDCLDEVITPWAKKHSEDKEHRWKAYQTNMMDTLDDIALKHRVSVTSVSLRWAMQLDHVASVVVSCSGMNSNDDRPFDEPEKLRQVFRFALDQEDMERLWKASGEAELVKEPEFNPVVDLENIDFENMEEGDGDALFLPDASNSKLWL